MSREVWKPVVGWEGFYSVSSHGRVRSERRRIERAGYGFRTQPEKILSTNPCSNGYVNIALCRNHGKEIRRCQLAVIVLETFIGPCPVGYEACHDDGDRLNNRADNLRWDTHANNLRDRVHHGTMIYGERAGNAKLTNAAVLAIRASDESTKIAAERFGTTPGNVMFIRNRRTWAHI